MDWATDYKGTALTIEDFADATVLAGKNNISPPTTVTIYKT
jgi:hypothetical protein